MKNAMGVGRCCCKEEPPIVWNSFCRAWNSEINQEFDDLIPLSGAIPYPTTDTLPNANINNPNEWSYFVRSRAGITTFNYSVQPKNPGIEKKIFGLQNQVLPRSGGFSGYVTWLKTFVNFRINGAQNHPSPSYRYDNRPSYSSRWLTNNPSADIPENFIPTFEFKINLRTMSPSTEPDTTVPIAQSGYSSTCSIEVMNAQQGMLTLNYYSATDPGIQPQKQTNIWYFGYKQFSIIRNSGIQVYRKVYSNVAMCH